MVLWIIGREKRASLWAVQSQMQSSPNYLTVELGYGPGARAGVDTVFWGGVHEREKRACLCFFHWNDQLTG